MAVVITRRAVPVSAGFVTYVPDLDLIQTMQGTGCGRPDPWAGRGWNRAFPEGTRESLIP